ncbi:MAG: hypothetical protein ACUVX8_05690 [Candidatus Zipacnadales bacterium]
MSNIPEPESWEDKGLEASSALPPPRRSTYGSQLLLAVAILLAGVVIGAGVTILLGKHFGWRPPVRSRTEVGEALVRRTEGLNLRPDQRQQVREIIRRRLNRVYEIRDESRRAVQEELNAMHDEVAKVLDPEQARRWREQWERMRRLGPPPPWYWRRGAWPTRPPSQAEPNRQQPPTSTHRQSSQP